MSQRLSKLINLLMPFFLIFGSILIIGIFFFIYRFELYAFIQKSFYTGYDTELAEESYTEGLELIAQNQARGIPFDFNSLYQACRIYNLLDPVYQGRYEAPWSVRKSLFSLEVAKGGPFHRQYLPKNTSPEEYWLLHTNEIDKLRKLWLQAFNHGGLELKYAASIVRLSLASCRPGDAVKTLAGYIERHEEDALARVSDENGEYNTAEWYTKLSQRSNYLEALDYYIQYYHIYNRILLQAHLKGQYPRLTQSSPVEARRILKQRIAIEKVKTTLPASTPSTHLYCLLGDLEKEITLKGNTRDLSTEATTNYNRCLTGADQFEEMEAYLGLAEIYLRNGKSLLARTHLKAAYAKMPDSIREIPHLRLYYINRMDHIRFAVN